MPCNSSELYKLLNGLIAIYKPHNITVSKFGSLVQYYLVNGFNYLPFDHERTITEVCRIGTENHIVTVPDVTSFSKVMGQLFYHNDFELYAANPLPEFASGVQVMGIGPVGLSLSSKMFEENMYMNVYRLTCLMGRSTFSGTPESNTLTRTSWRHVRLGKLQFILKNQMQAYLSLSYLSAGFTPNSQAAYEAMSKNSGLLRPKHTSEEDYCDPVNRSTAIIYGLSCIEFNPPFITIEMHVVNESIDFIISFTRDLGIRLKTAIVLTKLRRLRQGRFTCDDSLLLKELKYFNPDIIARHMDMSNTKHTFEDLQIDGHKIVFISTKSETQI